MALSTAQEQLRAATPAYQRYRLNTITKVAHDVVFSTELCDIDATHAIAFKPSIPPDYRLCVHCAANISRAGQLGDLIDEPQTLIWLMTRPAISEEAARAELAAKAPAPAATVGLVGAESERDPTRGDAGGAAQTAAQEVEAPSIDPPSPPAAVREPRVIVPFPLGGHSLAFLSPDSSNIERVTWLDGNADETELSWQYRDGTPRLLVEFKQDARYIYTDVPFETFWELYGAESVGVALNALVKKHEPAYDYRQLDVDELRAALGPQDEVAIGHLPLTVETITVGPPTILTGAAAEAAQREEADEPKRGRKGRNPTKGESELTAAQLAERDARERERAARLADDTIPEV